MVNQMHIGTSIDENDQDITSYTQYEHWFRKLFVPLQKIIKQGGL